jgi:microcystin-dependent protein
MADVKISALPAATTPLAGTEVLPIVQSGITAKVAVSNLTAGRSVSATALALAGSTSGTATIVAPAVAGTPTLTLPIVTGTLAINVPSGVILPYAASSAPTGWLLCYGQAVSRTTYAALFAVTSTTYGVGDGTTTFNLPDLRGRVAAGVDNMGGTAANRITSGGSGITGTTLGAVGGAETVALTTAQLAAHTHGAQGNNNTATVSNATANLGFFTSVNTDSAGSGTAHNNTQPTMMLTYIIKT